MFKFKTIVCDTRCIVLFFIILSGLLETNARTQRNIESICKTIRSQTAYSLNEVSVNLRWYYVSFLISRHVSGTWCWFPQMTGFWYGIEILEHIARNRPPVESCIKVDIKTGRNDHVFLTWREKNLAVTYTFYIEDNSQRGMWTSLGNQEGGYLVCFQ